MLSSKKTATKKGSTQPKNANAQPVRSQPEADGDSKCRPFSVTLAVLAPDNKRQVSFGLTKGCIDDRTPFYVVNFVLRDKVEGGFQDRVKLNVTVGDTTNPKAQALMEQGLNMTQIEFLQGPITARAKRLPASTTDDKKLKQLNEQLVDITPV